MKDLGFSGGGFDMRVQLEKSAEAIIEEQRIQNLERGSENRHNRGFEFVKKDERERERESSE